MPRILKLLLPLALFLGVPFLLDERVRPSQTPGDAGPARPAADRTALAGYRYNHYDPVSGVLVFELKGEEAIEEPAPAGSTQRRFALGGLWVRVAAKPGIADAFTPMVLSAPSGAVRLGEGGDTLVNLDGGVRGEAADGTTFTTGQIRVTVAERTGVLSAARAPGPIQVRGPGLALDAASGSFAPETGWTLDGPVTGRLAGREVKDPAVTEELKRSVIGLTAPQGLRVASTADPRTRTLETDGGIYLDRRATADGSIQSILTAQQGALELRAGVLSAVRLRGDVRAVSLGPAGACNVLVAAAAGAWEPSTQALTLTGYPRWYLRSGAELWLPGEATPGTLPGQSLAPKGVPGGWMGSAERSVTLTRAETARTVAIAMRESAQVAAVQLTPAHVAARALAPFAPEALQSPVMLAAHLANRNLGVSAGEPDAEVRARALDVLVHPRDGVRQAVDFDAADEVEIRQGGTYRLQASSGIARGRLVSAGPTRSISGELREGAQLRLLLTEHVENGRELHLGNRDPGGAIAFESTQAGAQRIARARTDGLVWIQETAWDGIGGRWEASEVAVEVERGSDGYERTEVLARGGDGTPVRFTAPRAPGGANAVLDELRGLRVIESGGGGREVVRWIGLRDGFAPAAVRFDLGGRGSALPGDPGSAWRLAAESGSIERTLIQRDAAWVATHSTVRLEPGSTVTLDPAANGSDGFAFTGSGPTTLEFSHTLDPAGKSQSVLERAAATGGADFVSPAAHVAADTLQMEASGAAQTWTLTGAPAMAKFRAGASLPLTTTQVPGGSAADGTGADADAPWFDARAETITLTRNVDPATGKSENETFVLSGHPVIGQLPAGGDAGSSWPVPEWELRSAEPLQLSRAGDTTIVTGSGGVRLVNYDSFGTQQAELRAPGVVVTSTAGGGSVAKFTAPFVAEGLTAAEAFADLGKHGGGDPVHADRVRIISRAPVTVTRDASSRVTIATPRLNILPLSDVGEPVRAIRVADGIRVNSANDGSWTFTFLGANGAAVPLEESELKELAKLANNR